MQAPFPQVYLCPSLCPQKSCPSLCPQKSRLQVNHCHKPKEVRWVFTALAFSAIHFCSRSLQGLTHITQILRSHRCLIDRAFVLEMAFALPTTHYHPDGWGPPPTKGMDEMVGDIPYMPYNKADRFGRVADWTGMYQNMRYNPKQGQYAQQAGLHLEQGSSGNALPALVCDGCPGFRQHLKHFFFGWGLCYCLLREAQEVGLENKYGVGYT